MTKSVFLDECPFGGRSDVEDCLKRLLLSDAHLLPYTRASFDAEVARQAKAAWDCVFKWDRQSLAAMALPDFSNTRAAAHGQLTVAVTDGSWTTIAKGRDLLKAYCSELGLKYEHFRNLLIGQLRAPSPALGEIIQKIKDGKRSESPTRRSS